MEASTQEKQLYLRQQILDSNYDPEQFVNFLKDDLQVEELDVSHMTMKSLESIVMKYKQYKFYQNDSKQEPTIVQPPAKKIKVDYEKNGTVYDNQFEQICRCITAQSFSKDLEIYIPNFQVKQTEGLFFSIGSRTEIWYIIKTNASKNAVKRLQEDFEWLSASVLRLFPLNAIPQLAPISKQSEGNHAKRRKELEEYLQILAEREELKRSNLFFDFLTIPAEKMEKYKKNCDSLGFAKGIQSIKNQQGHIISSITNKIRDFVHNTQSFNRKIAPLHESISSSIEKVTQLLTNASLEMNKIVDNYAEMHECYKQLINKSPEQNNNEYSEILININLLFHVLSSNLSTTSKIVQTNLKDYFKLSLNYDKHVTRVYRNVFDTERDYINNKINLNRRKERIYPDVSRWEVDQKLLQNRRISKQQAFSLMLPKQTTQQIEQKLWLGYLYNNYASQFQRYIKFEVKRYVSIFCTFTSEVLLNNKNFVEELTKFIEESKNIAVA